MLFYPITPVLPSKPLMPPPPRLHNGHTFVTELSTPVGLTEALPGFIAGAVDTSGMRDALIAVQALPTILASVDKQHTPPLAFQTAWDARGYSTQLFLGFAPRKDRMADFSELHGVLSE